MESVIKYFGADCKVSCDGRCHKAWGINSRPRKQLSQDFDDYYFLSDLELDIAPIDPGTYEGGQAKPTDVNQFPNKWCVRECERCERSPLGKPNAPLPLKDWTKRVYNQPAKHGM